VDVSVAVTIFSSWLTSKHTYTFTPAYTCGPQTMAPADRGPIPFGPNWFGPSRLQYVWHDSVNYSPSRDVTIQQSI